MSESLIRDFFNLRRPEPSDHPPRAISYRWVTSMQNVSITDNQGPNYPSTLFDDWTKKGWEIVSITPLPPHDNMYMCRAVAVLRRPVDYQHPEEELA